MSNKYLDFDGDQHLGFLLFPVKRAEMETNSKPEHHISGAFYVGAQQSGESEKSAYIL